MPGRPPRGPTKWANEIDATEAAAYACVIAAVTAVSAVALSYKDRDFAAAAQLAHAFLATPRTPSFAQAQLRDLPG
jgi:hypothetical protein